MVSGLFIGLIVGTQYIQKKIVSKSDAQQIKMKVNLYYDKKKSLTLKNKESKKLSLQYKNFTIVFCIFSILRIKEITIQGLPLLSFCLLGSFPHTRLEGPLFEVVSSWSLSQWGQILSKLAFEFLFELLLIFDSKFETIILCNKELFIYRFQKSQTHYNFF